MKKEEKLTPGLPSGFEDRWNKKLSVKNKIDEIIENKFLKYGFSNVSYKHLTLPTSDLV